MATSELATGMAAAWNAGDMERIIALGGQLPAQVDAESEGVLLLLGQPSRPPAVTRKPWRPLPS